VTSSLGTFVCKSVVRNNGITRLHFQRDSLRPGHQPEDSYFNVETSTEFVMGRKYQIQVIPEIGDQG
jgi:hypothetical protein